MATAQAAKNHGDEWGLTWYLRWGLYALIPTWTYSQNSLAEAEALSLKISSPGTTLIPYSCQVKQLLLSKAVLFIYLTIKWINKITINNSRSRILGVVIFIFYYVFQLHQKCSHWGWWVIVWFDVTTLYTNIPIINTPNMAKNYVNNDDQFTSKTAIPQDNFLDLVNLVLTNT